MNDREQDLFEAELRRLKPAPPAEAFMARLAAGQPVEHAERQSRHRPVQTGLPWWRVLRWLVPATAAAAAIVVWIRQEPTPRIESPAHPNPIAAKPAFKANEVEIDRTLVAAYDVVARLPSGEPVRLRCRDWTENVVLRDSAEGVVVERRAPRLEIVPVRFETY